MHVLIIKTSSLGDVVHTFPALSDAARAMPGIRFDWVVEKSYAGIPSWHPAVDQVIETDTRSWRSSWLKTWLRGDWKAFVRRLQLRRYDAVIDAQGLIKSAMMTRKAHGVKHGLDCASAREPQASRFYDLTYAIGKEQHAIERTRQLFARALAYEYEASMPDYGLQLPDTTGNTTGSPTEAEKYVVFLHGSAWVSKRWPTDFWQELKQCAEKAGYAVSLPAGSEAERTTARQIVADSSMAIVLPPTGLTALASILRNADGVVAVDTGLAHVAAAMNAPLVALYGATSTARTGVLGNQALAMQSTLDCAPCYKRQCARLRPDQIDDDPPCTHSWSASEVWTQLEQQMRQRQMGKGG